MRHVMRSKLSYTSNGIKQMHCNSVKVVLNVVIIKINLIYRNILLVHFSLKSCCI
jgi:hypothetical protein